MARIRKRTKKGRPGRPGRAPRPKQRAPAVHTDGRPLLSMAMMVKNEERFLEEALRSAQGFCDELVVVDTGSTDRTVEIARDLGAVVSHFPWNDSFSEARNVTLRRSTGRWIAVLDADERFRGTDPAAIRKHLVPGSNHPYEGISLKVTNTRLDGTPISHFHSVRLFPNDARLGYRGRVHNAFGAMVDDGPRIDARIYTPLEVVHLGYDPTLYAERKKAARSLPLIERTVAEEPENHQYRYYLGREYLLLGRLDDARAQLTRTIVGIDRDGGRGPRVEAAVHLMQALMRLEAPMVEVVRVGQQALSQAPEHPDLWFETARALAIGKRYGDAIAAGERAVAGLGHTQYDAQVELVHSRWRVHQLLGELYWAGQQYPACYGHYLAALGDKPADSAGWPAMLNALCGLAIDLGDAERVPALLDALLDRPDTPLGMFFFAVDQAASREGPDAARAMMVRAAGRCPRLLDDPEYPPRAARLGLGA